MGTISHTRGKLDMKSCDYGRYIGVLEPRIASRYRCSRLWCCAACDCVLPRGPKYCTGVVVRTIAARRILPQKKHGTIAIPLSW